MLWCDIGGAPGIDDPCYRLGVAVRNLNSQGLTFWDLIFWDLIFQDLELWDLDSFPLCQWVCCLIVRCHSFSPLGPLTEIRLLRAVSKSFFVSKC